MNMYSVVIFITGAATLALELLTSRIMTPYFGVSLYIWTGILSITLISLALGYFLGGKLSHRINNTLSLESSFLLMPAASAISMAIACLLYPWTFFQLAQFNLVAGSFIACFILLFFPLVTISAMNPLLIAMRTTANGNHAKKGDSGSGLVFFISTIGSVIGVWLTAFVFIPNITNFKSVLILGLTLSLISAICTLISAAIDRTQKRNLLLVSLTGLILCAGVLAVADAYLDKETAIAHNNYNWKIEKEYTSLFGNTKILSIDEQNPQNSTNIDKPEMPVRMYYQDGIFQNTIDKKGTSLDINIYALETLSTVDTPKDTSILVLGLAGGVLSMTLARKGMDVDVVEINPNSIIAAQEFFDFDATLVKVYQMDARSYVKLCRRPYHMIIVDLFQGDGVPDYLLSKNFFHDLKNCLRPDGAAIFNTFTIPRLMPAYYHLLKTVKSEFEQLYMFHDEFTEQDETSGVYLVAGNRDYELKLDLSLKNVPGYFQTRLRRIFSRVYGLDQGLLSRSSIITDEFNVFPLLNIENYLGYRKSAINIAPYQFLVN